MEYGLLYNHLLERHSNIPGRDIPKVLWEGASGKRYICTDFRLCSVTNSNLFIYLWRRFWNFIAGAPCLTMSVLFSFLWTTWVECFYMGLVEGNCNCFSRELNALSILCCLARIYSVPYTSVFIISWSSRFWKRLFVARLMAFASTPLLFCNIYHGRSGLERNSFLSSQGVDLNPRDREIGRASCRERV